MFAFSEIVADLPRLQVVDVGAAEFGTDLYAALTRRGLCDLVGFEPNPETCAKRNASRLPGQRFLPYALGDGRRRSFYECPNPLTSSLYEPNSALLREFVNMEFRAIAKREIETRRLDDVAELGDVDYLKLDVQGAELDVLAGAPRVLERVLVVHAEVEFIPMYVDQPLFGELDCALRKAGLWLHRLENLAGGIFKTQGVQREPSPQILYGDAVYVRSFMAFDRLAPEKLLKLAVILHEVCGSWEFAALALRHYDAQTGRALRDAYLARLAAA